VAKAKWKAGPGGWNIVLQGKGFFISYLPNTDILGIGCFAGDGLDETAIVYTEDGKYRYYIPNGDFREDYEKIYKEGLAACMVFFRSKQGEFGSSWSN
jgi:hypothetical protein